jgi:hypothetical protein
MKVEEFLFTQEMRFKAPFPVAGTVTGHDCFAPCHSGTVTANASGDRI